MTGLFAKLFCVVFASASAVGPNAPLTAGPTIASGRNVDQSSSEPPQQRLAVPEAAEAGTVVGRVTADSGSFRNFRLAPGSDAGVFAVDEETGQLSVRQSETLDFETTAFYELEVLATPIHDPTADLRQDFVASLVESGAAPGQLRQLLQSDVSLRVRIDVQNVPEAPVIRNQQLAIAEHSFSGAIPGTVIADDPDSGDTLHFELTSGSGQSVFDLDPETGVLRVIRPISLDFEQTSRFQLLITVTDQTGLSAEATMTVAVTDINDAPVLTPSTFPMHDYVPGHLLGRVAAVDPDCCDSVTYQLLHDPTGGAFELDNSTGSLRLADVLRLADWPHAECRLTVSATDDSGQTSPSEMVIVLPERIPQPELLTEPDAAETAVDSLLSDAAVDTAADSPASPISAVQPSASLAFEFVAFPIRVVGILMLVAWISICGWLITRRILIRRKTAVATSSTAAKALERRAAILKPTLPSVPIVHAAVSNSSELPTQQEQISPMHNNQTRSDEVPEPAGNEMEDQLLEQITGLQQALAAARETTAQTQTELQQALESRTARIQQLEEELKQRDAAATAHQAAMELASAAAVNPVPAASDNDLIQQLRADVDQRNQLILVMKEKLEALAAAGIRAQTVNAAVSPSGISESESERGRSSANATSTDEWRDEPDDIRPDQFSRPGGAAELDERELPDDDARRRMQQAQGELARSLPAWFLSSEESERSDTPGHNEDIDSGRGSTSNRPKTNVRLELAGLFDLQRRVADSKSEDTPEPSADPAHSVHAEDDGQESAATEAAPIDDYHYETEDDHSSADHDDYISKYMSRLLKKPAEKVSAAPRSSGKTSSTSGPSSPAASETVTHDRRKGDRRRSDADRRSGPETDGEVAVTRQKIDVESLRLTTNSFREIALQSVEQALASHTLRKAKSEVAFRMVLLGVLLLSMLLLGGATLLKLVNLPWLNWMVAALVVSSAIELVGRGLSIRGRVRRLTTRDPATAGSSELNSLPERIEIPASVTVEPASAGTQGTVTADTQPPIEPVVKDNLGAVDERQKVDVADLHG